MVSCNASRRRRPLHTSGRRHVQYIMIPGWAQSSPVIKLEPTIKLLGQQDFPLVASFAPYPSSQLTMIYQVGGQPASIQPAVFPGDSAPVPDHGRYTFPAGTDDESIFVSDPTVGTPAELRMQYFDAGVGSADIVRGGANLLRIVMTNSRTWKTVEIGPLLALGGPAVTLDVHVHGHDLVIRDVVATSIR